MPYLSSRSDGGPVHGDGEWRGRVRLRGEAMSRLHPGAGAVGGAHRVLQGGRRLEKQRQRQQKRGAPGDLHCALSITYYCCFSLSFFRQCSSCISPVFRLIFFRCREFGGGAIRDSLARSFFFPCCSVAGSKSAGVKYGNSKFTIGGRGFIKPKL